MTLLFIALAPILIIGFYIFKRDKHEPEPVGMLFRALLIGGLIVIPILFLEYALDDYWTAKFSATVGKMGSAAYEAFVVASFSEEGFKYLAVMLFFFRNKNFNEKFDGIVYAAFVSLGFALVENVLYVFQNGMPTGYLRAFTAVPLHAIAGISMGYFLGFAKMNAHKKSLNLLAAFVIPFLLHGFYDFILMSENELLLLLFIPYLVGMFIIGFRKMRRHSNSSRFNPKNRTDIYS